MITVTPFAVRKFELMLKEHPQKAIRLKIYAGHNTIFIDNFVCNDITLRIGTATLVMDTITARIARNAIIDCIEDAFGSHFDIIIQSATK